MKGYWNGESAQFRVVEIIVGDEPEELRKHIEAHVKGRRFPWWEPFIGTKRQAVEVAYQDGIFYLDNNDGMGFSKVTVGMGSPQHGHRSIYPSSVIGEVEESKWIKFFDQVINKNEQEEIDNYWIQVFPIEYAAHKEEIQKMLEAIKKGPSLNGFMKGGSDA